MNKFDEKKKQYDYRPVVHITPPSGWTNDPNGMVYVNGEYHFFYQHYPSAPHWGPMYWGHCVSRDLLHWKHLPIALYPDELGVIFSGSCVLDKENVSGFGTADCPPMIAFFTSHGIKNHFEQQSMAYSVDYKHFEKYYGNPVIPNPGQKDFRDPKIFWNPVRKCYSIVLAAGDHVDFYASTDLKSWEKTGEFKAGEHGLGGICECPDCFPLMTEEGEKWVLIISMILPEEQVGRKNDVYDRCSHITQYYVGQFDGDKFVDTEKNDTPLVLDFGTDNYAAVTFQNLEEKVMMGWADNWDYANFSPTDCCDFRGKITLPRKMELVKTSIGYRLAFSNEGLDALRCASRALAQGDNRLRTSCFGMKVRVNGCGSVEFKNSIGEQIVIRVTDKEILVDRTKAGLKEFHETYAKDSYGLNYAPILTEGPWEMEIVFDKCILEVLGDNGLAPVTASVFPTSPYEIITVSGDLQAEIFDIS